MEYPRVITEDVAYLKRTIGDSHVTTGESNLAKSMQRTSPTMSRIALTWLSGRRRPQMWSPW